MNTLQINATLLREAEQQARLRNINLSEAVEAFIRHFISQNPDDNKSLKITSFVAQLGVDLNLPTDFDEREAYRKHFTAVQSGCDALITRNVENFVHSDIPVFLPDDFLKEMKK